MGQENFQRDFIHSSGKINEIIDTQMITYLWNFNCTKKRQLLKTI